MVLKLILQLAKKGFRLRKCVNHGFKKTGLPKFQSEEVIETEVTPGEQLMNLIERFDKFACSDYDDE